MQIVYIAPLKALVRERIEDWKVRFEEKMGKHVAELTGDVTPDFRVITSADVIVTTPEKWDGISRSWHTRGYVKQVSLIIIDEIHLLGRWHTFFIGLEQLRLQSFCAYMKQMMCDVKSSIAILYTAKTILVLNITVATVKKQEY